MEPTDIAVRFCNKPRPATAPIKQTGGHTLERVHNGVDASQLMAP